MHVSLLALMCSRSVIWCCEMVDAICLTIYSQTGLAATQTKQSSAAAIRQALLGTDGFFSGMKTIRLLLCTFL